jgi:hypothetical protein
MKIEIEYKDIVLLKHILKEKEELYKNQIVTGYTDDSTSIDTINEMQSKQKRIGKIFERLNRY